MNDATLRSVCSLFDLGSPRGLPVAVAGGLTNRMWRTTTSKGEFAVKQMNRDHRRSDYVAWFDRAFTLELAAHRAGVPTPLPIATREGRCLGEISGTGDGPLTVRVHAWVEGVKLENSKAYPAETIAYVATVLARIHALHMTSEATAKDALRIFGEEHWRVLAGRLQAEGTDVADDFLSLLPVLHELEQYLALAHADPTPLLLSHRDADMKNFLRRSDGKLLLVDWDAAGPVNARQDVANHALVWAGVHMGEPNVAAARTFVEAYMKEAETSWSFQRHDLAELVSLRLGWFDFNVHRALGERTRDDSDRQAGLNVVRRNVEQLPRFQRSLESWLAVVSRLAP